MDKIKVYRINASHDMAAISAAIVYAPTRERAWVYLRNTCGRRLNFAFYDMKEIEPENGTVFLSYRKRD